LLAIDEAAQLREVGSFILVLMAVVMMVVVMVVIMVMVVAIVKV